jgi:hypothetical protein
MCLATYKERDRAMGFPACDPFARMMWIWVVVCLSFRAGFAGAEEKARTNDVRYMARFEWANDIFTGTDDGPTVVGASHGTRARWIVGMRPRRFQNGSVMPSRT